MEKLNVFHIPATGSPKEVRLGLCQRKTFNENCPNLVQLSKSKVVGDSTRNQPPLKNTVPFFLAKPP